MQDPRDRFEDALLKRDYKKSMELLVSIYAYMIHKAPTAHLRQKWAKELRAYCNDPKLTGCDFEIKVFRRNGKITGGYFIRASCYYPKTKRGRKSYPYCDASLGYDNTSNMMDRKFFGPRHPIATRADELGL